MRTRAFRYVLCMLAGLLTLVGLYRLVSKNNQTIIALPDERDIQQMTGMICKEPNFGIEATAPFTIPPQHYHFILEALKPAMFRKNRLHDPALGKIWIHTKHGDQDTEIVFFSIGKNRLNFTVNEKQCARGGAYKPAFIVAGGYQYCIDEAQAVAGVLMDIRQMNLTGAEPRDFKKRQEMLRRSWGKLPTLRDVGKDQVPGPPG